MMLKAFSGRATTMRPARLAAASSTRVMRAQAPARRHHSRKQVQVQAIFGLFGGRSNQPASSARAAELVDELLEVVSKGRPAPAQVEELVNQLRPLTTKNPVRSKLLFGTFKLAYSSKGGLASTQILEEPDRISELSESKALLLTTKTTQSGELNGINNDTYEEAFDTLESKSPLGGETRAIDVVREVQVLYLDSSVRIARVKAQNDSEGTLAVYARVTDDEEEEDEEDTRSSRGRSSSPIPLFGGAAREGTATIAEREVRRKMEQQQASRGGAGSIRLPVNLPAAPAAASRPGTGKVSLPSLPRLGVGAARAGTTSVKAGTTSVDKKKEAEAKAREAASAREKAEAERRAAAERQAAIKAQLDELTQALKDAQAEARDAARETKELERANGATLKQVASARLQLRAAADGVAAVEEDIQKAAAARAAAEAAVKEALAGVNAAQSKVKAAAGR